jgi:hypothetical protein
MSFAVSGATTIAAGTATGSLLVVTTVSNTQAQGGSVMCAVSLTAGVNTFTAKYAAGGSTATFSNRQIIVIPLP